MNKIMRFNIADYLNVAEKGSPEEFAFMGVGFNTLDESPGAQTDSKTYINQKTQTSTITSYQTEFSYDADFVKDEKAVMSLYKVGRDHLTGEDAERDYIRVDLYDPVEGHENLYKARKFRVAVVVSDSKGNGGEVVVNSGTLNCVGDPVQGYFNTVTKTFTEEIPSEESSNAVVGNAVVGKATI